MTRGRQDVEDETADEEVVASCDKDRGDYGEGEGEYKWRLLSL